MKKYVGLISLGFVLLLIQASFIEYRPENKEELGRLLFFDPILSKDRTVSCASCHQPDYAFSDTSSVSVGVNGMRGVRNTPTTMNLSLQKIFFWDGRASSLEEQALAPIENPVEMNLPIDEAIRRLRKEKHYVEYFQRIFDTLPTPTNLAVALAAFERTLETYESSFDQWKFSNDSLAVSPAVKRGFDIFNEKGKCNKCHFGADFTTNEFRNIGLFNGRHLNDSGRMAVSRNPHDLGKFKVPTLRNIEITAPYMHNGLFSTLKEVIDFYNDPGSVIPDAVNRDSILSKPLGLSIQEKADLEQFLIALTDKRFARTIRQ